MKSFEQFLVEKEKRFIVAGANLSHKSKIIGSINPAKPAKPVYSGLNVQQILPVPRCGKPKSGVIGS